MRFIPDCTMFVMSIEVWRAVVGYEGHYEVSNHGNVRSLKKGQPVPLKQGRGASRYWLVVLYKNGKGKSRSVHSLVLESFSGPCPEGWVARHLDDNPDDNSLGNLVWGTRSENSLDIVRNGNHPEANKTHCPAGHAYSGDNLHRRKSGKRLCRRCQVERRPGKRSKLTRVQWEEVIAARLEGVPYKELADRYQVSKITLEHGFSAHARQDPRLFKIAKEASRKNKGQPPKLGPDEIALLLRMKAAYRTNQEIADRLNVSVSLVKSIYRREQAT